MTTYKMRCECFPDVLVFQQLFVRKSPDEKMEFHVDVDRPLGETVITFKTVMTRKDILKLLHRIPDAHVMWQTVQPVGKYTGERDFSI